MWFSFLEFHFSIFPFPIFPFSISILESHFCSFFHFSSFSHCWNSHFPHFFHFPLPWISESGLNMQKSRKIVSKILKKIDLRKQRKWAQNHSQTVSNTSKASVVLCDANVCDSFTYSDALFSTIRVRAVLLELWAQIRSRRLAKYTWKWKSEKSSERHFAPQMKIVLSDFRELQNFYLMLPPVSGIAWCNVTLPKKTIGLKGDR